DGNARFDHRLKGPLYLAAGHSKAFGDTADRLSGIGPAAQVLHHAAFSSASATAAASRTPIHSLTLLTTPFPQQRYRAESRPTGRRSSTPAASPSVARIRWG